MSLYLAEIIPQQIITYLQTNMSAALAAEAAAWPDGLVPLQPPEQYYTYEEANPPQCPALYALEDQIDYQLDKKNANHISAIGIFRCGMIVEEFTQENSTHSCRRWANVLHKILNRAEIDYAPSSAVVARQIVKIRRTSFSSSFKKDAQASTEAGPWRKEFVHELEVEHYENFS
jgi:hypothetical protein